MLNSLWGKVAERAPNIEDIVCQLEVHDVLVAGGKYISRVRHTDEDTTAKSTNLAKHLLQPRMHENCKIS